jgi:hypothetical protein
VKRIQTIPGGRGGELTPFEPGERRVGRPAGAPNKTTRVLKEAGILAAEIVGFPKFKRDKRGDIVPGSVQARGHRHRRQAHEAPCAYAGGISEHIFGPLDLLIHVKGYAALETRAAAERARLLIGQAEAVGEPIEDPLLLFSVLYGIHVANLVAFNGDVCREVGAQFLALAEKQDATVPLMIGHPIMGVTFVHTGNFAGSRAHLDRAFALYDPVGTVRWRRDLAQILE